MHKCYLALYYFIAHYPRAPTICSQEFHGGVQVRCLFDYYFKVLNTRNPQKQYILFMRDLWFRAVKNLLNEILKTTIGFTGPGQPSGSNQLSRNAQNRAVTNRCLTNYIYIFDSYGYSYICYVYVNHFFNFFYLAYEFSISLF